MYYDWLIGIRCSIIQRQIMRRNFIVHRRLSIHCMNRFTVYNKIIYRWRFSLIIDFVWFFFSFFSFYSRQTMVLVFYLLCIILMMIIRPILNVHFLKNGRNAVYNALYFIPILGLLHTIVGGLICKKDLIISN